MNEWTKRLLSSETRVTAYGVQLYHPETVEARFQNSKWSPALAGPPVTEYPFEAPTIGTRMLNRSATTSGPAVSVIGNGVSPISGSNSPRRRQGE